MDTVRESFHKAASRLQGATVAIVYAHSFDPNLLAKHYLRQRTETLTGYADIIDLLGGYPVFFNIEQFLELSADPDKYEKVDLVINVPGGSLDISNLILPAAIASKMGKPIFPASGSTIAIGQNKPIASSLARQTGWQTPREFDRAINLDPNAQYITKPKCAGDSYGVRLIKNAENPLNEISDGEFLQEFIEGYDFTTYLIFDHFKNSVRAIHSSLTLPPETDDTKWFWSLEEKNASSGRGKDRFRATKHKRVARRTTDRFEKACTELAVLLGVNTLARIDTRLKNLPDQSKAVDLSDAYFLEINVLPSITPSGSWSAHLIDDLSDHAIEAHDVHELFPSLPPMQSAMLFFILSWVSQSI